MKKSTICVTGHVLVCDILMALEPMVSEEVLLTLDNQLKGLTDERLKFDDIEILAQQAIDELDEADMLPEPESLADTIDQADVQNLAAAIRRGDRLEAEVLLDRVFRDDATATEWIQLGRYSAAARQVAEVPARKKAA